MSLEWELSKFPFVFYLLFPFFSPFYSLSPSSPLYIPRLFFSISIYSPSFLPPPIPIPRLPPPFLLFILLILILPCSPPPPPQDDDPPAGVFSRRGACRRPLEGREVASRVICGCGGCGCGLGRIVLLGRSVFFLFRRPWRILVVGCGFVIFVGLKSEKEGEEEQMLKQIKKNKKELDDQE